MADRTHTRRRACASFALFALLLTLPISGVRAAPPVPTNECESTGTLPDAGGTKDNTNPLPIPAACRGSLTSGTDEQDWYSFDARYGREFKIRVIAEAPLFAVGVKIIDSAGKLVLKDDAEGSPAACVDNSPRDECSLSTTEARVNDTFYLVLTRETGSGSYDLETEGQQPQNDCGTPGDAGAEATSTLVAGQPKPLPLYRDPADANSKVRMARCDAAFEKLDTSDGFSFNLSLGSIVFVDFTANADLGEAPNDTPGTVTAVQILDPAGTEMLSDCEGEGKTNTAIGTYRCKFGVLETHISGQYVLQVSAGLKPQQVEPSTYFFRVTVTQDDCADISAPGTGGDAPDTAPGRPLAGTCNGSLDPEPAVVGGSPLDAADRFTVVSDTATLKVTLRAPNPNCVKVDVTPPGGSTTTKTECVGTVVFEVPGGSGTWAVDLTSAPGAPVGTWKGGMYTLTVTGMIPLQADCATSGDVTTHEIPVPARFDDAEPPVMVPLRENSCAGDIRTAGDVDTYTIPGVAISDIVEVELSEGNAVQACLTDKTGASRGCTTGLGLNRTVSGRADTAALTGSWTVVVGKGESHEYLSAYSLTARILSQDDCTSGLDGGNVASDATPLPQAVTPADTLTGDAALEAQFCGVATGGVEGVHVNGQLRHPTQDTADWYSVNVLNQYTALTVALASESPGNPRDVADLDVCVIPPGGEMKCSPNPPGVPEILVTTPVCPVPQGPEVPSCGGTGDWKVGVIRRTQGNNQSVETAYRLAIAGRN